MQTHFVDTQLNDQTVLFLTIESNVSYLFAFILNVKHFHLTHRWDPIKCYFSEAMVMKCYSAFP